MHYLDQAATTAVAPEVADMANEVLRFQFANPSSLYEPGMRSEALIERTRDTLAGELGCSTSEVVFTGGGTEADNLAVLGLARARNAWAKHIVSTGYEHPAVHNTLKLLEEQDGFQVTWVAPGAGGTVSPDDMLNAVRKDTALVCAMQVNNETGALLDVATLAQDVKKQNHRTAVHVDGVQGFTRLPLRPGKSAIDTYAVSGHKLHGPKGVGALYIRGGCNIAPVLAGGGQENGRRPGTENTAYIAAFGGAVDLAAKMREHHAETVRCLRRRLLSGLETMGGVVLNSPVGGYEGIVNFSLPGVRSETMLHHLEGKEVYVSAGSACSKGQPSHTLTAMGLAPKRIAGALRVSFDGTNDEQDIDALLEGLAQGLQTLARAR